MVIIEESLFSCFYSFGVRSERCPYHYSVSFISDPQVSSRMEDNLLLLRY